MYCTDLVPQVLQDDWSRLLRALQHDTGFLSGQGVMDYSLLVGVDRSRGQLVVGVIDYVRQYTWDKQLETWVKSSGACCLCRTGLWSNTMRMMVVEKGCL